MYPPMPPMMLFTEEDEVLTGFNPGSHLFGVTHTGVVLFQGVKVNFVLDCKFDVAVMEFKLALTGVCIARSIAGCIANMSSTIGFKVSVMRV